MEKIEVNIKVEIRTVSKFDALFRSSVACPDSGPVVFESLRDLGNKTDSLSLHHPPLNPQTRFF